MSTRVERFGSVELWRADGRDVLADLSPVDLVLTDPVWPNPVPELAGSDRPYELFAEVAAHFPRICQRAIVVLGCTSDPRFLVGMPEALKFLRVIKLEYAVPLPRGRVLYDGDIAYAFGWFPAARGRGRVFRGRHMVYLRGSSRDLGHPCPRSVEHMVGLVGEWARGSVLDPFMGVGTTAVACVRVGVPFVGVEISDQHFSTACRRVEAALSQGLLDLEVVA